MFTLGIVYFIAGLILIALGASIVVSNTEKLSSILKISYFISSLLFIGIATSAPEIFISILSALDQKSNIAVGNALGSNIANIAFVFAISLLFLKIEPSTFKEDLSSEESYFLKFLIFLSFLIFYLLSDGVIDLKDSFILSLSFLVFLVLYKTLFDQVRHSTNTQPSDKITGVLFFLFFGLSILLIGTEIFLRGAISIATMIGVSDYIIGLSITAIGTSIPELAASIASIRRKRIDFIFGNILGSNIFNILLVIGIVGFIDTSSDLIDKNYIYRDILMIFFTTLMLIIIRKNYNLISTRLINIILLISFVVYQYSLYQ